QQGAIETVGAIAGAATGNPGTDMAIRAIAGKWAIKAFQSPGFRLTSARVKDSIAKAIYRGDFVEVGTLLQRHARNTPETQALQSRFNKLVQRIKDTPNKQGGFLRIAPEKTEKTFEQILEEGTGWKPGTRVIFDTALRNKDAATIRKMLPDIPKEYAQRFSK